MPLANVALTDTFDTWRVRTNQIILQLDQANGSISNVTLAYDKANLAATLANNAANSSNAYTITVGAASNTWANSLSTLDRAISNTWANTVALAGNNYINSVGLAGNNYTNFVGSSGNNYTNFVGTSGNNYAVTIGAASNAWSNTIATSGNNYAVTIGAASNAWANTVTTVGNNYAVTIGAASNAWANTLSIADRAISNNAANSSNAYTVTIGAASNTWANTKVSSVSATAPLSSTGGTTPAISLPTTANVQIFSLGVGTAASQVSGEIRAANNITAYYSDKRLKKIVSTIPTPLEKVTQLSGVIYINNEVAESFGYGDKSEQVGVIAQEVQNVLPQIVKLAPFDTEYINGVEISKSGENYKTVQYDKLVPLLIEAIKELNKKVEDLKSLIKD